MPPPPPPPMKYVSKTAKSPPRRPSTPPPTAPASSSGSKSNVQSSGGVAASGAAHPTSATSSISTPERPAGGTKSPVGRSRAMSRPAGRPPPQFSEAKESVVEEGVRNTITPAAAIGRTFSSDVSAAYHQGGLPPPPPPSSQPPSSSFTSPNLPSSHHQPANTATSAPVSNKTNNTQLDAENRELRSDLAKLKGSMDTLQRDNALLNERLGSLLDSGITPSMKSVEAYTQSQQKDALLNRKNATSSFTAAGDDSGRLEVEFMKARISRLEAALALEMRARESLEDTCAAQKKVIVHRLAAMQSAMQS